ncbi:MAG TPA: histidinol-phosphate transaminase [Candidatus Marinimicrobia bacterium]|jgi:histidinol-phosphate aminotransferase|nr:histidinol-phosphate transaminase [Candidatus Neomarinimicrobiota bacterium]
MIPQPRPCVLELPEYVPGDRELKGIAEPIKLSSNESTLGPSPQALKAYADAATQLHRYPDPDQNELRDALAEHFGLAVNQLICGNGSAELIQILIHAYVGEGDEVLLSEYGFPLYRIFAISQGASVALSSEVDCVTSVDSLLECVTPKTKLVAIANPNNPTGTYLSGSEVRRLHANLPEHVLLLLDEAYAEYVTAEDFESGLKWADETENVVVARTFSKLYGLAALRIGWMLAPQRVFQTMQRFRITFNTNGPALATAVAALHDVEYTKQVQHHNHLWRKRMTEELEAQGLNVIPSMANFLLIQFLDEPKSNSEAAANALKCNGIIPRPVSAGSPPNCMRITIGKSEENQAVLHTLKQFMKGT